MLLVPLLAYFLPPKSHIYQFLHYHICKRIYADRFMGKDSQNSPITIKTLHSLLFTLHNSSVLTPKCHETTFMSLLKKRFTRRYANYTLSLGPRPPKFRSTFRKIHAGSLIKQQGLKNSNPLSRIKNF